MAENESQENTESTENTGSTESTETSDPLKDLKKTAEGLVIRAFSKGKNAGKKESKDPFAKKHSQIGDSVLRMTEEKRRLATSDKKFKLALRNAEDSPSDPKLVEAAMKMIFMKYTLIADLSAKTTPGISKDDPPKED